MDDDLSGLMLCQPNCGRNASVHAIVLKAPQD
jgi:hypothetical protein